MTAPVRPVIRDVIATLPRYRAGRPASDAAVKLSSNENPYAPLPGVLEAASRAVASMNRYPDLASAALTEATAEALGVAEEQIAFGTGSVAVLATIIAAVAGPGDEVVHAWRSFEAYPIAVQASGASGVRVPVRADGTHDLDAMAAAITERTRAVLVCTPNNPTGPTVAHADLLAFVDRVPGDVLVLVDEAYVEFADAPDAARGLDLLARPNVVVLRTFSKAHGLAGLRVGFCVADPEVAGAVRAAGAPFGVSLVAQAAALASLRATDAMLERVAGLVAERRRVRDGLRELGFDVPASGGNFVWLPTGERTAEAVAHFDAAGLIVRGYVSPEADAADRPTRDGVRITIGDADANDRVLRAAADWR